MFSVGAILYVWAEKDLEEALEEYPAMSIGIGEKLLNMLGLSKDTQVKKL